MSSNGLDKSLADALEVVISELYGSKVDSNSLQIQQTRKEFDGDRTIVVFPFLRLSKKSPEATGEEIGNALIKNVSIICDFNVIKGFLNISIDDNYWIEWLESSSENGEMKSETFMVEYSSPNTNKPLHLGHIRNNLLGYSVSRIIEAQQNEVLKVQVINDRGIHICKSMLAWQKFGNNETPDSSGKKGDHLVGDYYVRFDQEYKAEVKELQEKGSTKEEAEKTAPILKEAQKMLIAWEAGDKDVRDLWRTMNDWVYQGFDITYRNLGVSFDKLYYESETYITGKEEVLKGLEKGIFYKKDDGSVWVNLSDYQLDEKLLIRSDGTSVYMTQDIGTAILRFRDYPRLSHLIYTVGDEQNYHFKVLFLILKKLGYEWADNCRHLSYGMVELPSGKMKSREGTVVDADDLIEQMIETAKEKSESLGKLEGLEESEKENLFRIIGLGALKYFILKVDPKKQIVFNPEESIDFNGNTGPFVQYTYARIKTLVAKSEGAGKKVTSEIELTEIEKSIIKQIYLYTETLKVASQELNPAVIANYVYELVKLFNQFYQSIPILKEENSDLRNFRINLSEKTAIVIQNAMSLLGIEVPDRM